MKATLHYGLFNAKIEVREPKMDIWIVEPIEPTTVLDSRIVTNPDFLKEERLGKLHFRLATSPRIGENLEYRFVGKE